MNQVLAALRDAPHVSVSAIKTYMMCPMKYAHRYVFKTEPTHRSVALVLGSAVHEALAVFYTHHGVKGEDPPEDLVTDTFSSAWDDMLVGDPPVRGDDLGADKDMGISILRAFYESAPRPIKVLAVELPFSMPLPTSERVIVGAIDAVVVDGDGRSVLVEHKTAPRRWSQVQLDHDIQPTIYQLAARHLDLTDKPTIRFDFLMKQKKPSLVTEEVHRSSEQEQEALEVFTQILWAVDTEVFFPFRGWGCAGCEFTETCGCAPYSKAGCRRSVTTSARQGRG